MYLPEGENFNTEIELNKSGLISANIWWDYKLLILMDI